MAVYASCVKAGVLSGDIKVKPYLIMTCTLIDFLPRIYTILVKVNL
jgi:hypothetical protein